MANWFISTDLDGTLLNHVTHDYAAVLPMLNRLQLLGVTVVLNSTKTTAELSAWQEHLDLNAPLIAENGGVVRFDRQIQLLGRARNEICDLLQAWRAEYGWQFAGYSDWSLDELTQQTGFTETHALLASQRLVTEPILWQDSADNFIRFERQLTHAGLSWQKAGRFYHIMAAHNKASAVDWLLANRYQGYNVLALGDGSADRLMLEQADLAVVLSNEQAEYLAINQAHFFQAPLPAPQGWVQGLDWALPQMR